MQKIIYEMRKSIEEAKFNIRIGQALFNALPIWAGNVVAGTPWDPYHRDLTWFEVTNWMNAHLIFNNDELIAVMNNDEILAERPN